MESSADFHQMMMMMENEGIGAQSNNTQMHAMDIGWLLVNCPAAAGLPEGAPSPFCSFLC
jgi:hypothetical protein